MVRKKPEVSEILQDRGMLTRIKGATELIYPDEMGSPGLNDTDLREAFDRGMARAKISNPRHVALQKVLDSEWIAKKAGQRSGEPRFNANGLPNVRNLGEVTKLATKIAAGEKFGRLEAEYGTTGAIQKQLDDYWRPLTRQEYNERGKEPLPPPYADGDRLSRFGQRFDHWVNEAARNLRSALNRSANRPAVPARHRPGGDETTVGLLSGQSARSTESFSSRSSSTPSREASERPLPPRGTAGTAATLRGLTTASASSLLPPGTDTERIGPSSPPLSAAAPAIVRAARVPKRLSP